MLFPNLIIAGPPKTGTTSLFNWLSIHPEVHPSSVKETNYFENGVGKSNFNANYLTHGLDKYPTLFPGYANQKVICESSPGYLYSEIAIEGISKVHPLPTVIFIYRDPAERIYSEYRFQKYKVKSFAGTFEHYLGWDGQQFQSSMFERGKIVDYINKWKENYKGNLIIIDFKSLKNPKMLMQKLCVEMGISSKFYENFSFETKNETYGLKNRKLHLIALKTRRYFPSFLKKMVEPIYYSINKSKLPSKTEDESLLMEHLKKAYADQAISFIQPALLTL